MRQGGEDLLRQFNKGTDYIQSSFMTSEGIFNKNVPNFIYKGIVIDVNFERTAPTTTAGITPPFMYTGNRRRSFNIKRKC